MDMKEHILAALREQVDRWEALLTKLGETQIVAPVFPSDWSVKVIIAHLRTWQQRSLARFEAALSNHEPEFPEWLPGINPDADGNADLINAWVYATYHEQPWSKIHQDWKAGYLRLIEMGTGIPELNLLETGVYPWMGPYPLGYILLATYSHHQEHYEILLAWLQEHSIAV